MRYTCESCKVDVELKEQDEKRCPRCGYKSYIKKSKEKETPKVVAKKDIVYTAVQCENCGIVWDNSLSVKCPICGKIGGKFINKKETEEELVKV